MVTSIFGKIAVDAAAGGVELNAARWADSKMLSARADIKRARLQRVAIVGFFHADFGELGKLRRKLRGERGGHVLHQNDGSGKFLGEAGRQAHHGCGAAGGCRKNDYGKALVEIRRRALDNGSKAMRGRSGSREMELARLRPGAKLFGQHVLSRPF